MRLVLLQVCGFMTLLLLLAALVAIARHRAMVRAEALEQASAWSEYTWALVPWILMIGSALPAVHRFLAQK